MAFLNDEVSTSEARPSPRIECPIRQETNRSQHSGHRRLQGLSFGEKRGQGEQQLLGEHTQLYEAVLRQSNKIDAVCLNQDVRCGPVKSGAQADATTWDKLHSKYLASRSPQHTWSIRVLVVQRSLAAEATSGHILHTAIALDVRPGPPLSTP